MTYEGLQQVPNTRTVYLADAAATLLSGAEISIGVKVSRYSFTTHSEIQGQDRGLTTPVKEHFAS